MFAQAIMAGQPTSHLSNIFKLLTIIFGVLLLAAAVLLLTTLISFR